MSKKIILVGGVLAAALVLFFVFKNVSVAPIEENEVYENDFEKIQIDPNLPGQTLPLSNDPKDVAWTLFQKYLSYNKTKNLEGVKSTIYKVAAVCEDPKLRIDCEGRMGAAYSFGSALKKEDFTNIWSDEKQIILSTDFEIDEDDSAIGRNRAVIFFVKDESGQLKMLSFSPFKGVVISKGAASRDELVDRLVTYTEDKDNDGIAGYYEECIPLDIKDTCTPTDPNSRDTNGNGLWDGIEELMK